jgi:hypothetical protein
VVLRPFADRRFVRDIVMLTPQRPIESVHLVRVAVTTALDRANR